MLTATRDKAAAMRFFDKSMQANDVPEKVTMDKSGANKAAIDEITASSGIPIIVRQVKSQQHRRARPQRCQTIYKQMLNFKSFRTAKCGLAGIELLHMIRKGQLDGPGGQALSPADQLYSLAI